MEDREKFDFQINQPLPGQARKEPSKKEAQADLAAFGALAAMVGQATIPPSSGGG